MAEQRQETQAAKLLEWLDQAAASRGKHKPVLSVGRDGITLPLCSKGDSHYEVASTDTGSVLARRGRRQGTVSLAYTPEPGQPTMSKQLTELLEEVLRVSHAIPLARPRKPRSRRGRETAPIRVDAPFGCGKAA